MNYGDAYDISPEESLAADERRELEKQLREVRGNNSGHLPIRLIIAAILLGTAIVAGVHAFLK